MAVGFHEVQFPTDISYGSSGGPEFKTHVFNSSKGFEKRNMEWDQPLMRFNVAYGVKTDAQMMNLINFFNARQGRAYAFRYRNQLNNSVASSPIAIGNGESRRLPIVKVYGTQESQFYKRLHKIVAGTVSGVGVGAAGVLVEGVDYSIDYNLGEIALNTVTPFGVPIFGSLEFDEPVRFDTDSIQPVIDAYNNQSLSRLELVSVRDPFPTSSLLSPTEVNTVVDPLFSSVRLLLNFDDTTILTTTVDSSSFASPVVMESGATLVTDSYYSGKGSLSVGTSGKVSVTGVGVDLSSGAPFTLELFAQHPASGIGTATQQIFGKWDTTTNQRCWRILYKRDTQEIQFVVSSNGTDEIVLLTVPWASAGAQVFEHIAVDRTTNNWYVMRLRGEVVATIQHSGVLFNDPTVPVTVGNIQTTTITENAFSAHVDSVRATVGHSRYGVTGTMVPPSSYPVTGP